MNFLQELSESKLIAGSRHNFKKFTAQDISNQIMLQLIALQILKFMQPELSRHYMGKMPMLNNFNRWTPAAPDLYVLLHCIYGEGNQAEQTRKHLADKENSQAWIDTLTWNRQLWMRWAQTTRAGMIDNTLDRRFFMEAQRNLRVQDTRLQSLRRLVSTWGQNSQSQNRTVFTRLLQIMRIDSRRSELLAHLEYVNKKTDYFDKKLGSLEDEPESQNTPTRATDSKLVQKIIAGGAGFAAGYALGSLVFDAGK